MGLEDIVVETLSGMTIPSVKDFEKRRGVLAWNFDLEPQAEKVIKHGFKITWPKDMQVGFTLNRSCLPFSPAAHGRRHFLSPLLPQGCPGKVMHNGTRFGLDI